MRPTFYPRLVNGPFDDPGLFVSFVFKNRALLFDLGDLTGLSSRDLLKITHVFISHTHMDHFIGFDKLLRIILGREKTIAFFGPPGFLANLEGKLAAYTWNLVNHYSHSLVLQAAEIFPNHLVTKEYPCARGFLPSNERINPFNGTILKESGFQVEAKLLDHRIPCLGFAITENFHVNILKNRVKDMGLALGPWLSRFKDALYRKDHLDTPFYAITADGKQKKFLLADLAKRIALITKGQKVGYITDVVFSEQNAENIVSLVKDSDHLFIEAGFLEKDSALAKKKYHLTAQQSGHLAKKAGVKQFTIFHHSPRYFPDVQELQQEAMAAFLAASEVS